MWHAKRPDRDPSTEKAAVVKAVDALLGPTVQAAKRRKDWRLSGSGTTSVFITFSQDDDLFYDVSRSDLDAWAAFPRSFVIFVMGSAEDVLVLPVSVLQEKILPRMTPKERGNFKLHITGGSRLHFREVGHIDLGDYHNALELLSE